jgi:hypothetical protein
VTAPAGGWCREEWREVEVILLASVAKANVIDLLEPGLSIRHIPCDQCEWVVCDGGWVSAARALDQLKINQIKTSLSRHIRGWVGALEWR